MAISALSSNLQELVQNELVWDPEVTATIGVTATDGIVTLTGFVASFPEREAAERAALRVIGTKAVANELVVTPQAQHRDLDIAKAALGALAAHMSIPKTVKLAVHHGHLTLEGTCEWWYQRNAAENAVRHVPGVVSFINCVRLTPRVSTAVVSSRIEAALRRSAQLNARNILVTAEQGTVSLRGTVHSSAEREEALRAAWSAPGVTAVENNIVVVPEGTDD